MALPDNRVTKETQVQVVLRVNREVKVQQDPVDQVAQWEPLETRDRLVHKVKSDHLDPPEYKAHRDKQERKVLLEILETLDPMELQVLLASLEALEPKDSLAISVFLALVERLERLVGQGRLVHPEQLVILGQPVEPVQPVILVRLDQLDSKDQLVPLDQPEQQVLVEIPGQVG